MKKPFIAFYLFLFVVGILFSVYIRHSFHESERLSLTELKICDDNRIMSTNDDVHCETTFLKSKGDLLYLCGKIMSSKRVMDPIYYLYEENSKNPIYHGPVSSMIEGYFCTAFPLANAHRSSNYTIKIYYFRRIIATLDFHIQWIKE